MEGATDFYIMSIWYFYPTKWRSWSSYFVHQRDDLKDELVLPQVVSVFEDDRVHGSILSLEDQLGWHQSTLTHTGGEDMNEKSHDWLH